MALSDDGVAPYAPTSAVALFINHARDKSINGPVTIPVLSRIGISDSLTKRTLAALKQLDLVGEDGALTPTMEAIRVAPASGLEEVLADWVRDVYKPILAYVDPSDPVEAVIDQFRPYEPQGMRNRMVTLFFGLCEMAGLLERIPTTPRKPADTAGAAGKIKIKPKPGRKRINPAGNGDEKPDESDLEKSKGQPDPLIAAYFQKLPASGSAWSSEERDKYLTALKHIFDIVYTESDTR